MGYALTQQALKSVQTGDIIMVGMAGAILVGAGLLQKSLGDVIQEESMLPPAAGAKAKRESQRSKRFLKRNNNRK